MTDLLFQEWNDLDVLHIARAMRAADRVEIGATRPDNDPWALYRDMAAARQVYWWFETVRRPSEMMAMAWFGVVATSPGNGTAFMAGTDDLSLDVARQVAARIRQVVIPALTLQGLIRVEAHSLASHAWAHRFLRRAGAVAEGPPRRNVGKRGEAFQTFVWLAPPRDAPALHPTEAQAQLQPHL
jgi:hypothetical protein